ncbi:uncharacterized protein BKA78DRAFT_60146 [Phyllosticta capitalensis]
MEGSGAGRDTSTTPGEKPQKKKKKKDKKNGWSLPMHIDMGLLIFAMSVVCPALSSRGHSSRRAMRPPHNQRWTSRRGARSVRLAKGQINMVKKTKNWVKAWVDARNEAGSRRSCFGIHAATASLDDPDPRLNATAKPTRPALTAHHVHPGYLHLCFASPRRTLHHPILSRDLLWRWGLSWLCSSQNVKKLCATRRQSFIHCSIQCAVAVAVSQCVRPPRR